MPANGKPRSNAERQATYRRRHLHDLAVDGVEMLARLNLLISVLAKARLERLAACYGVTQRSLLEHVLDEAENIAVTALPGRALNDYYDKRPTPLRGSRADLSLPSPRAGAAREVDNSGRGNGRTGEQLLR